MSKTRSMTCRCAALLLIIGVLSSPASAQQSDTLRAPSESDYYEIKTIPIPEDVVLEVGGMALLPSDALAVTTRRGEIWIVDNPYLTGSGRPTFRPWARGLHEPLGLAYRSGALFAAQRGELTRMTDTDGDGQADRFERVYAWPLAGNYHEYSYGPVIRPDGTMLVTLNLAWVGRGASLVPWRGWLLEITPDGEMTPFATGMRSPAGFTLTRDGEIFYAENQGDWVGSGRVTHVERGDFLGNPAGLRWTDLPGSPLRLSPDEVPNTGEPMFDVAQRLPPLKPATVWFPHGILGISTSDVLEDTTAGGFGPFTDQLFVGDQGHSKIMRMALEQVDGTYQGVVFPFIEGFASGVLRMAWGRDGSMFVGQTSRGWDATGKAPYALQRVVWTGAVPFEARTVRAMPDGFEIEFTQPVDAASASNAASYEITGFTYKYHETYGSPVLNRQTLPVRAIRISDDGVRARLAVDGLREGYIHEIKMPGVRSAEGHPLLHDTGYYTLNRIPEGHGLAALPSPAEGPARSAARQAGASPMKPPADGDGGGGAKRITTMPSSWDQPDATITLGTLPGLRYDLPSFEVKAGARVRLVFNNGDDMTHNVVVVVPGTADAVAEKAIDLGLKGSDMDWVPESEDVLVHSSLLQPETSESIYFTAPSEPGEYTYVCTFPGHAQTMRGTMRVIE